MGGARSKTRAIFGAIIVVAAIQVTTPSLGFADDGWWTINFTWENDSWFSESDKHYTNGFRGSIASGRLAPQDFGYAFTSSITGIFPGTEGRGSLHYSFLVGQSIFTPQNLFLARPDPRDRPYAGWLYVGSVFYRENPATLDLFEIDLGLVGPGAGGERVQNGWHDILRPFTSAPQVNGWSSQLRNEPGIVLAAERKWRWPIVASGAEVDVLPHVGGSLGNVFTYAAAGGMIRFGERLAADWGQPRVRPSISGSDFVNYDRFAQEKFAWYVFAGTEVRLVGRNIFLDGNTFRGSPNVDKEPLVADLTFGATLLFGSRFRLGASYTARSEEFETQKGSDHFVAFSGSFQF